MDFLTKLISIKKTYKFKSEIESFKKMEIHDLRKTWYWVDLE